MFSKRGSCNFSRLFSFALLLCGSVGPARSNNTKAVEGPTFGAPIANVTVTVGREAIFSCVVEGLSTYKVAWLQVNTQTILTIANHVITKNHRIGVTHSDHRTWHLHIREVRETDIGDYMCQINTDPMKSQVGSLKVVVPPDILDDPNTSTDMVVREGSNVTLKCAATGSPTPNITWRRETGELIPLENGEDVSYVEGSMFNITKVNRLHMGAYLCIASNGVPPTLSKRIMLTVHFPPMISVQNQLVGARIGQQVTLDCYSEAFPKSINYWTRENDKIITHGAKYEPAFHENSFKIHMKLTIREVGPLDYGIYKCVSKNSLGGTDGSIRLHYIETPTTPVTEAPSTTTSTAAVSVEKLHKVEIPDVNHIITDSISTKERVTTVVREDGYLKSEEKPFGSSSNNRKRKNKKQDDQKSILDLNIANNAISLRTTLLKCTVSFSLVVMSSFS